MEELNRTRQKKIITKLVSELAGENPDLYYTDSSTIASLVFEKIKAKELNATEYELVSNLKAHDILILMSYNSNCC